MSYQGLEISCIKHPEQKLTHIDQATGDKKCPICIVHDTTKSSNHNIKDRYCIKHPGYEQLFFCQEDLKGLCEKCLDFHQDHQIITVALEARNYRKELKQFQEKFKTSRPQWESQFKSIEDTKKAFDKAKELEIKEINQVFHKIFLKLEQKKKAMIDEIGVKRQGMSTQMDQLFHQSFNSMKEIAHMDQQILEFDHQYQKSDFDVVKDYNTRNDPRIFQNFCESYNSAFLDFNYRLDEVKGNQFIKHNFQLLLNEELLETFVNSAIFVENTDLDINEFLITTKSPQMTKTNNTFERTVQPSILEDAKFDDSKATYESPKRQNQKVKINHKKSSKKLVPIKPAKVLAPQSQIYYIDRDNLKIRFFYHESSIAYSLAHQIKTLRDMRSIQLNQNIYLFDSTETHLSELLFSFNHEQKSFIQVEPNFECPRRKISACTYQDRYIIFTGELENNKVERGSIEKYDTQEGTFTQINGLNISHCNYILCVVNDRYLYAFPISINTHKLQIYDLKANEEVSMSMSMSKKSSPLKEGGPSNHFKWQKVQQKMPLNFRVFLNFKSQAIQINLEEILLTGNKTSYIYNFKKDEFTHYYNYVAEDEFLDGLYKSDVNQNQIIGMGYQGLHVFDYLSRKWTLYDELNYLGAQNEV